MMHRRRIGAWEVFNIVEYAGPTHDPARVFPDLDQADLDELADALGPDQYVPALNRFVVAIQIWVARRGDTVIVIDGGCGNGKDRAVERQRNLNTRTGDWLAAAGAAPGQVTHVVNTHLHSDHVGWNVADGPDGPLPRWPGATYLMPQADIDHFGAIYEGGDRRAVDGSWEDSVLPVLRHGKVHAVTGEETLAEDIRIVPVPGHTPGMYALHLTSESESGVFCADIFHSPVQILRPHVNTAFCILPDQARATRARFLDAMADTGTLIMPCHFGFPHCGRIVRRDGGYALAPDLPLNGRP